MRLDRLGLPRPVVRAAIVVAATVIAMVASFAWTLKTDETRHIAGAFHSDSTLASPLAVEYSPPGTLDQASLAHRTYREGRMSATEIILPALKHHDVDVELCGDVLFDEMKRSWPVKEIDRNLLQVLEPELVEIDASSADRPLDVRFTVAAGKQVVQLPPTRGPLSIHEGDHDSTAHKGDPDYTSRYHFGFVYDGAPYVLTMRSANAPPQLQGTAEVGAGDRLCWILRIPSAGKRLREDQLYRYESGIQLYGDSASLELSDAATEMTVRSATGTLNLDDRPVDVSNSTVYIRARDYPTFFLSDKGIGLQDGVADSVKINGQEQITRDHSPLIPSLPNVISALVGAAIGVLVTADRNRDGHSPRADS